MTAIEPSSAYTGVGVAELVADRASAARARSGRARRRCSAAGSCRCRRCSSPRPTSRQTCPTMAACWSPRHAGDRDLAAERPLGAGCARRRRRRTRAGSRAASRPGRRRSSSSSSSQVSVSRSISMVRHALVTSVTCTAAVGAAGQVPDQPGVDGAEERRRRPRRAARTPSTLSRIHCELAAGEVGRRRQPGPLPDDVAAPVALQRRGDPVGPGVLPDDGVVRTAGRSWRSQTTVVSRWLVMPTRGQVRRARASALSQRSAARPSGSAPRSPPGRARPSRAAA